MSLRLMGCAVLVIAMITALPVSAEEPKHAEPVAGHDGAAAGHGDHHEHLGEAGVNKDPSNIRADLAIYSLAVFLILFGGLSTFAWGPIVKGLEQREHGLRSDINAAKGNREASERLLAQHQAKLEQVQDEVREIFANARKESEKLKEEILATANTEADAARKRAVADIEQARDAALNQLFDHMSLAVTAATRQIVGRSVTAEDQERLIRESLSDLTRNLN